MAAIEPTLFSWQDVDARSDLDRLILVRDHLPDARVIQFLQVMRCQVRDDFPVTAMWNALLAGVVFQHPSIESLIRELSRNPALLEVCGLEVLPVQKPPVAELVHDPDSGLMTVVWSRSAEPTYAVPNGWNFSHFLRNIAHRRALQEPGSLVPAVQLNEKRLMVRDIWHRPMAVGGE